MQTSEDVLLLKLRHWLAVRRSTVVGVTIAFGVSAVIVLAAAMFSRTPPAVAEPLAGVKVGKNSITLDQGIPQWNVIKLGKAAQAGIHWSDPVTARVRIDETRAARIGSPLTGRVKAVFVELGQIVKEGDPLFAVASPALASLRSDAAKARVDLQVAKAQYDRVHDMVRTRLLPGKDDLAAAAGKRQAELSVTGTQAMIGALRVASNKDNEFTVTAPRSGVVVDKNILPAQEVATEGTLVQIADVSDVWVVADVFESDAVGIKAGLLARVTVPSLPGFSAEAPVDSVSAVVDPVRHSVQVRVLLANKAGTLRPNEYADMRFRVRMPEAAVEVPSSSLVSDGATQHVYVEASSGHFLRRKVVAGAVRDNKVAILDGLRVGETIVEEGGILLENQIDLAQ